MLRGGAGRLNGQDPVSFLKNIQHGIAVRKDPPQGLLEILDGRRWDYRKIPGDRNIVDPPVTEAVSAA